LKSSGRFNWRVNLVNLSDADKLGGSIIGCCAWLFGEQLVVALIRRGAERGLGC
jgi:hypothetical protein